MPTHAIFLFYFLYIYIIDSQNMKPARVQVSVFATWHWIQCTDLMSM